MGSIAGGARFPRGIAYTVEEVATHYKVTKMTVYRWIKSGKLHAWRLPGTNGTYRTFRIDESELADFDKRAKRQSK